jgi:signal transduction histidine kinase
MDSNERLIQAVQRATRKLASTGQFESILRDVLAICVDAVRATNGTIYLHDPATKRLVFKHVLPADVLQKLPTQDIPDDFGSAGVAFQSNRSVRREFSTRPEPDWNDFERATGVQVLSLLATPLSMEDEQPIGVVQLINKEDGSFTETDVRVMDIISAVATMAYLNAQLLEQSARALALLGMGRVSHDIGNLAASLYATLNFGDMAMSGFRAHVEKSNPDRTSRMFIESLSPIFQDLKESVERIVGYSELISDISAGRPLRPNLRPTQIGEAVYQAASYFESQGKAQHVQVLYDIQESAPDSQCDELYIVRIVQNLVGNAIKAVRETLPSDLPDAQEDELLELGGSVSVRYVFSGNLHRIEVSDTGPGMTEETRARILSGTAKSQWERASGSGWGLRIVSELTSALGGTVDIESKIGQGSTFIICIPHEPIVAALAA